MGRHGGPQSSIRIISRPSARLSPLTRTRREKNCASQVRLSKDGNEPSCWASPRSQTMQATENRELLEVLLHEAAQARDDDRNMSTQNALLIPRALTLIGRLPVAFLKDFA